MTDPIRASRRRSIATLRRTLEILQRVVGANRRLMDEPAHRATAEKRVSDGEEEILRAESELGSLEGSEPIARGDDPTTSR
jgi:hypothetical protein